MARSRKSGRSRRPLSGKDQAALDDLARRSEDLPEPWRPSLRRRVEGVRRAAASGRSPARSIASIHRDLDDLLDRRAARADAELEINYPDQLPVCDARMEIQQAIREHQVVILCGETGSGKTTQLPKLCAEIGLGVDGMIGHTQPRRVAARSIADRVAKEMGSALGEAVGYSVRFNDRTARGTRIRMMTDGILLAETQRDRDLLAYDTIIIDEAHERSLNIDFLLGYLARLRTRRPDLKIIITSATIDPQRFSRHFGSAPVIEVSGRTHPVEIRWRPLDGRFDEDGVLPGAILDAVRELDDIESEQGLPDILVFLPGEAEIHDTMKLLRRSELPHTEVVPLYARLPAAQQDAVFAPGSMRRIVLSTNVAETSLTVPRIRAVIDSGLARISRYSARSRVQRLPIEDVSRASADQRAGRCGRIGPGTCIRLYDEAGFEKRAQFTQPEIMRTNLASVILQMTALRLGAPEDFPFIDRPSARLVRDGYDTLQELGAIDRTRELTDIGKALADLPVDPRIGRMILASTEEGCLGEMLVIASALSVQDPRERPANRKSEADLAHAAFRDSRSDFLGFLRLWRADTKAREEMGSSKYRNWCKRHHLSVPRLREWTSVHRQLEQLVAERIQRSGRQRKPIAPPREDPPSGAIHRSILSGLLANVGHRTESGEYQGVGGIRFEIFPGSVLRRENPPWIVCAEIVETTRKWGRTTGRIRGEWIERVAPHMVRRDALEPHFVPETGHVAAWERVTYGNLVTIERRQIPFAPENPVIAREVFIQEALVEEKYPAEAAFLEHNRAVRRTVEEMEDRGRADGILADETRRYDFYDGRIPADVHNIMGFEQWRRNAERRDPTILHMTESDLMHAPGDAVDLSQYPDRIETSGVPITLHYQNNPGDERDGVTARISIETLGTLDRHRFDWLVPGLLANKIEALIRSLPRRVRTRFMPIHETAAGAAEHLPFGRGALLESLARYLETVGGMDIPPSAFRLEMLEPHQFMRFELLDEDATVIAVTRNFDQLLERYRERARHAFEDVAAEDTAEDEGTADDASRLSAIRDRRDWDFGELPIRVLVKRGGRSMRGHPAVADDGFGVRIRVTDDEITANRIHAAGVRRLLALQVEDALRHHFEFLGGLDQLSLLHAPLGDAAALRRGLGDLAVHIAASDAGDPADIRDRPAFLAFDESVRRGLWPALVEAQAILEPVLVARQELAEFLDRPMPERWHPILADERRHLDSLVPSDVASRHAPEHLRQVPRYLAAIRQRFDRLRGGGEDRDVANRGELEGWIKLWQGRMAELNRIGRIDPATEEFRWMLEEYRVALFAQELGTTQRVSPRRLTAAWDSILGR